MEEVRSEGQLRRPFTDIQNLQTSDRVSVAPSKGCLKPPLSNKAKAIELGRQTLAAYKERRARAQARRTAAKDTAAATEKAAGCPPGQVCLGSPSSTEQGCAGAAQSMPRAFAGRHSQAPTRIPSAAHPSLADAQRMSAPTPTKIPSPPVLQSRGAPAPTAARAYQFCSTPASPRRVNVTRGRPCSTIPAPTLSLQALCIEDGLAAGQCNPLYDDAALRAKAGLWGCPAQDPASGNHAAMPNQSALNLSPWAPQDAAAIGQVQHEGTRSSSAGNAFSSCTMLAADAATRDGSCGPPSVRSVASGLSRSGSFAPSALSVLYENQAMKMERAELKSELRLISARGSEFIQLAVLEARSKGWGRAGQAPKGRSQSAPRGIPRSRIISSGGAASKAATAAAHSSDAQQKGSQLQRTANSQAIAPHRGRQTVSRPSSPKTARGASLGSRASSPVQQRRAIAFGSRASSPAKAGSVPRPSRRQAAAVSGQPAQSCAPGQQPGTAPEAPAPSMPYRSAFMGGHMIGTRRVNATAAVAAAQLGAKPDVAISGPPAPAASAPSAACPSSVERWAGPGGRLGRTQIMKQTPQKSSSQKASKDKENCSTAQEKCDGQISKLALTATKLGLEHAFRPRHA